MIMNSWLVGLDFIMQRKLTTDNRIHKIQSMNHMTLSLKLNTRWLRKIICFRRSAVLLVH